MSRRMTVGEWEKYNARRKELADAKAITYRTSKEWSDHYNNCPDCNVTEKPYKFCATSMEIHGGMAKSEWTDLPMASCVHCAKEWEESDYHEVSEGQTLTCSNCGMIHDVTGVEWTISVELTPTRKFDPFYSEDDEEEHDSSNS